MHWWWLCNVMGIILGNIFEQALVLLDVLAKHLCNVATHAVPKQNGCQASDHATCRLAAKSLCCN